MKKLLLCDLTIGENVCNQRCEYCLSNYDNFHDEEDFRKTRYLYHEGNDLYESINKSIENLLAEFDVAALKIIGGEILLVDNIIQLLEERQNQFINLQMMTNGIMLNEEIIARLAKIPNLHLQISFDSSNFEGNMYRNKSRMLHDKLLNNVDTVMKYNIPLEINCVLTDKSIEYLEEFLAYLNQYAGKPLILYPFPVRGDEKEKFFSREDQYYIIERIIENYDTYNQIMPPVLYYKGLLQFLKNKKRQTPCSVPFHSFQMFENGEVTPCPFWWTTNFGNMITEKEKIAHEFSNSPIYRMIFGGVPRLSSCGNCYVRGEVLNLFFEGQISIDELARIPFYRNEKMKAFLCELKRMYDMKG